ncbi:MAG: uracil-DNA glycosylase [Candidatus Marinimicrobia bacterium]|nr:uracil-DNA glycosylase [Candidatus Neomarinimicrobiota bacterium]
MIIPDQNIISYFKRHQALFGDQLILGERHREETTAGRIVEPSPPGALQAFNDDIKSCRKCALGASRRNFVFGAGNPDADLVFVGEAPGEREDQLGEPFVGRAGILLDKILAAIDLTRQDVYILNVLKCRPPNNRDPVPEEVKQCEPYLKQQLRIIKPKLIVALGRVAAKTLLRLNESLKNMRKNSYIYEGIELRVTYHPAALLRNSNFKAPAWEDFQAIRDRYRELTGTQPGSAHPAAGEAKAS